MNLIQFDYRNWKVLITQSGKRWVFACFPPEGEPLNNRRFYNDYLLAQAEAKTFIDRMIIRCRITNALDDWLEAGQINSAQHDQIDQLVGALVKMNISDHFEFAQKPLLELPENQTDSSL